MKYPTLLNHYSVEKTIGCGGFAKVKLATHVLTGEKVAIKIMQKQLLMEDLPRVKQEIEALKSLSHPNICKLYQVIETDTHYFLVMEYCSGGELFDHIVEKQRLSENEARCFFRQIVSAVSYLHSQGYAHRDLKPENILLDKAQNLKLIDFGLCVKPHNGLGNQLHTSCGSPNYAAPELIRGEEYFGAQIDIWSLGVLLYALLCGTLPFDDICIQKLYEKILSGHYEEKEWLSAESKSLLRVLLQINAKKRITTNNLRFHPWLTKGYKAGVEIGYLDKKLEKDDQCLKLLANYFNKSPEDLWSELLQRNYDYIMASYLLMLQRKYNNFPLRLLRRQLGSKAMNPPDNIYEKSKGKVQTPVIIKEETQMKANETYLILRDREILSRKPSKNDENRLSGRKACKRIRSPGIEEKSDPEAKKIKPNKTPVMKRPNAKCSTPSSARKMLEGIEKGLNLAMSALTPRRSMTSGGSNPVLLGGKDLCNVTSTNSNSPEEVLTQLRTALNAKGIVCTRKGFTLRGKLKSQPNEEKSERNGAAWKLSFELEVCWLPSPLLAKKTNSAKQLDLKSNAVVGIRRKRLKGDAWIYKNICEEVLAVAAPQTLRYSNK